MYGRPCAIEYLSGMQFGREDAFPVTFLRNMVRHEEIL